MLLTSPGYSLRAAPGSDQPQTLKLYPETTDWWTIESGNTRPSGNLNGGSRPTFLERVDAYVTLRTRATSIHVMPLDGSGEPMGELTDIEQIAGGFRLHLTAASPWYAITAVQPPAPRRRR